jgi:hypothetical protein
MSQCHELHGIRSKRAGTYDSIVSPSAILPVFRAKKRATQNANQEVARVATALRAVFSSASLKLRRPRGAWLQDTWSISPIPAENEFRNTTEHDRANNCYVTNPFPPGRPKR